MINATCSQRKAEKKVSHTLVFLCSFFRLPQLVKNWHDDSSSEGTKSWASPRTASAQLESSITVALRYGDNVDRVFCSSAGVGRAAIDVKGPSMFSLMRHLVKLCYEVSDGGRTLIMPSQYSSIRKVCVLKGNVRSQRVKLGFKDVSKLEGCCEQNKEETQETHESSRRGTIWRAEISTTNIYDLQPHLTPGPTVSYFFVWLPFLDMAEIYRLKNNLSLSCWSASFMWAYCCRRQEFRLCRLPVHCQLPLVLESVLGGVKIGPDENRGLCLSSCMDMMHVAIPWLVRPCPR